MGCSGFEDSHENCGVVFFLLKRGLIGSFHRVSIKHLHRYLTEFEYRFNARRDVHIFQKTVAEMLKAKPMPMKELTA